MELEKNKCCFCGKIIDKYSTNDARPIKVAGLDFAGCCDECNARIVIPTRIAMKWDMDMANELEMLREHKKMGDMTIELFAEKCRRLDKKIEQLKSEEYK